MGSEEAEPLLKTEASSGAASLKRETSIVDVVMRLSAAAACAAPCSYQLQPAPMWDGPSCF